MSTRLPAELFVAAVKQYRGSTTLGILRGSEDEAVKIAAELNRRHGPQLAKTFERWRQLRQVECEPVSPSGLDLQYPHL